MCGSLRATGTESSILYSIGLLDTHGKHRECQRGRVLEGGSQLIGRGRISASECRPRGDSPSSRKSRVRTFSFSTSTNKNGLLRRSLLPSPPRCIPPCASHGVPGRLQARTDRSLLLAGALCRCCGPPEGDCRGRCLRGDPSRSAATKFA